MINEYKLTTQHVSNLAEWHVKISWYWEFQIKHLISDYGSKKQFVQNFNILYKKVGNFGTLKQSWDESVWNWRDITQILQDQRGIEIAKLPSDDQWI